MAWKSNFTALARFLPTLNVRLNIQDMIKTVFTLLLAMGCIGMQAQSDFATLPAKERSKMAEQEELDSERDQEFQRLMTEGMQYFENREFESALQSFEQAAQRRPLNVYPPVMVADVELSMELEEEKAEEKEVEVIPQPEQPKTPQMTADERVALMYEAEMRKVRGDMPPPPPKVKPEAEEPLPVKDKEGIIIDPIDEIDTEAVEVAEEAKTGIEEKLDTVIEETEKTSKEVNIDLPKREERAPVGPIKIESKPKEVEVAKESREVLEDGMTERTFKEGNKEVRECLLTKDGKTITYREVKHNWGGVFYFKDGESISKREWDEEIPQ
jgi:hypothetical protein